MSENKKPMSNVRAIRVFFGKVDVAEFKTLTTKEREELGKLCREALRK